MWSRVPAEALLALLALLSAACAAHELSPVPFTFAARYGRSPDRFITPRNDRWMMTTRYGKRAELPLEVPLSPPSPLPPVGRGAGGEGARGAGLACRYTGVMELYRCTRTRVDDFSRRGDDDPAPSDE